MVEKKREGRYIHMLAGKSVAVGIRVGLVLGVLRRYRGEIWGIVIGTWQ